MSAISLQVEYYPVQIMESITRSVGRVSRDMKVFLGGLSLVWVVYAILVLMAPTAETVSRYGLTLAQAQLLRVSFILPYLFIWVTAMFSVVWFRRYTGFLKGSGEEKSFHKITLGLWMLLGVLVLPSFVTAIANYFPSDLDVQRVAVIVRNYITVVLYLFGFWYLWQASKKLLGSVNNQPTDNRYEIWTILSLATLATLYSWAVTNNTFRTVSADPLVKATYYLPDFLIICTIVIPYLVVWSMGARTIFNIKAYSQRVSGVIYKKTFSSLAHGLSFTVGLLIFLQFLTQASASLSHLTLKVILAIIYLLLFAIAVGYLLIARGARKLSRIEEIE